MSEAKSATKIDVYRVGLVHCSVCVPKDATREEIENYVNAQHPTGIELRWQISSDAKFSGGQPNPCPCNDHEERLHYLMVC